MSGHSAPSASETHDETQLKNISEQGKVLPPTLLNSDDVGTMKSCMIYDWESAGRALHMHECAQVVQNEDGNDMTVPPGQKWT